MYDSSLQIGRLRVRGPADTPGLRLRLERSLAPSDLRPAGLPPGALLFVRHLAAPPVGRSRAEWERARRVTLTDYYHRAVRPAHGPVDSDAPAVLFADLAELLACLADDIVCGRAAGRWWWHAYLRGYPPTLARLPALLAAELEALPPALALLTRAGRAHAVLQAFTPQQAISLALALAQCYGVSIEPGDLPGVSSPTFGPGMRIEPGYSIPSHSFLDSGASGRRSSHVARPQYSIARDRILPRQTRTPAPPPQARSGIDHRMTSGPASEEVGDVAASRGRQAVDDQPRARDRAQAAAIAGSGDIETPPARIIEPMPPARHAPAHQIPPGALDAPAPSTADPALATDTAARLATVTDTIARPTGEPAAISSPWERQAAASLPPGLAREHTLLLGLALRLATRPSALTSARFRSAQPAWPARQLVIEHPVDPSQAPAFVESIIAPRVVLPAEGVPTELGGVLFLINLLFHLELPECAEPAWNLAGGLGAWGLLELLARGLLNQPERWSDDPIWMVLAELDQRSMGSLPAYTPSRRRAQRGALRYRIPVAWLAALSITPETPVTWASTGRRLRIWSERGILLAEQATRRPDIQTVRGILAELGLHSAPLRRAAYLDAPLASRRDPILAGAHPRLRRWLAATLPAVRARLGLALGIADPAEIEPVLLLRQGWIQVSATHLDLTMNLEAISLAVRLAGLDRDPGWRPEFGRVIRFHFEEYADDHLGAAN